MSQAVKTALYRHWGDRGVLLYVGIAANPLHRMDRHRDRSTWFERIVRIDVEWFDSREAALAAERQAIKTEGPWFNRAHAEPVVEASRGQMEWAVLHGGAGCVEGWYRLEEDAQEVMEFLREQFREERFLLVKESSAERRKEIAQFDLVPLGSGKWVMKPRNSQISAD